ncbi:MAG: hypothetical protein ABIQ47_13600 [Tepidiformaceae bacterium]
MLSTIVFIAILAGPFILFLISALTQRAKTTGILGGIKMPKMAKTPKGSTEPGAAGSAPAARAPKVKRTTMRARRVTYCGRGLSHFALAIVGSEDACRHCGRLESVPPGGGEDDEAHAAVAEVEQLLDRGQQ